MRKILFRGKVRDEYATNHPILRPGDWVVGGIAIGEIGEPPYIVCDDVECVPVIPDTVGQFTGLSDKNGVKIFEGDIVQWERDEGYTVGEVVYSQEHCGFVVRVRWFSVLNQEWRTFETEVGGGLDVIIGNIHDNPELLET